MTEVLELGKVAEVFITLKVNRRTMAFDFVVTGAADVNGTPMNVATGERVLDDTLDSLAYAARNGWRIEADEK